MYHGQEDIYTGSQTSWHGGEQGGEQQHKASHTALVYCIANGAEGGVET